MGTTWTFKEAPIEHGDGATIWYIPAMKNAIIMVIAGVLVQSLLAQILGMLRRPTADARQPVRAQLLRYSDFFFREMDWWTNP